MADPVTLLVIGTALVGAGVGAQQTREAKKARKATEQAGRRQQREVERLSQQRRQRERQERVRAAGAAARRRRAAVVGQGLTGTGATGARPVFTSPLGIPQAPSGAPKTLLGL